MSGTSSHTSHASHTTHASHATHSTHAASLGGELSSALAQEHKAVRGAYHVDSKIHEVEVLTSGNPKRIRRYFARKLAYKLFGKLMGKTINRL
jgi:hypothetical protein